MVKSMLLEMMIISSNGSAKQTAYVSRVTLQSGGGRRTANFSNSTEEES